MLAAPSISATPILLPRNSEARQCQCPVGLLGLSVACDHSAADMAAGGCSRTATESVIPLHPSAAVLTDLRDHAVRLMKRRGRHCLGGGCDGQSKSKSETPNHCFLHSAWGTHLMRDKTIQQGIT